MKNRKLIIFIGTLIILFIIFLFLYNKEFDYTYEYKINEYDIIESFSVEDQSFNFSINDLYEFYIQSEYSVNRGLITSVSIENNCIYVDGDLDFYTICSDDGYYFGEIYLEEDLAATYENFEIYDLSGFSYYIWDYDGFIYISEDETKKLTIFENDVYSPTLIKQVGDYLFIPNYDDDYYFSSYYLINMKKAEVKEIELDTSINFDMAYLNYTDTSLSIYDKKNEKVYTIKLSNGNQETKQGISYTDSELKSYEITNEYFFIEEGYLKYELIDFKISLFDYEINDIIYEDESSVIFLSDTELIYLSLGTDFNKILSYSEWAFNYDNLIFVY